MQVTQLTPNLGAQIDGLNLAALTEQQVEDIKAAFTEHLVLVFRDQSLTTDQLKAFGRLFGPLQLHPAKTHLGLPGDPEIFDINITARTKVANGESWHTDLSCEPVPPMASALYITLTPECGGGDTLFANMQEAYATLSEPLRHMLDNLTAYHNGFKDLQAYGYERKPTDTYPCANHPVVPIHPDTGKPVLFVNEAFTESINELSAQESDALLRLLYRHIETNTRFHARVQWQPNTLVLWDNRAVHHHAVWDYYPHARKGERVTIQATAAPSRN